MPLKFELRNVENDLFRFNDRPIYDSAITYS